MTLEIPDGLHDLQVIFPSIPPTHSNVIHIEAHEGDMAFEAKIIVTPGHPMGGLRFTVSPPNGGGEGAARILALDGAGQ